MPASVMAIVLLGTGASALRAQDDERLAVHGLSFDGNRYIDDFTLRASVATSHSGWFARTILVRSLGLGEKRFLDETELRRDLLRIQLLYRRSGFFDVRVDTLVNRSADAVSIKFLIDEGEPTRVTDLTVTGMEGIVPRRDIVRDLPLQVGDPFDRLLFLAAADTIRSRFRDRGYAFAEVFRNFDEDRPNHTATVSYEVYPGPRALVDTVTVLGQSDIDESLVRRTIPVREGQPFSESGLVRSQQDLYRLGVFDFVNVSLVDSMLPDNGDSTVGVRVQVSEGRLRRIRAGGGYGTLDCFRTLTSYTWRNFLGGGRTLNVSARLSKIGAGEPFNFQQGLCPQLDDGDIPEERERLKLNYNLTASLRFPYVLSPNTSAAVSLSGERRSEVNTYLREAVGVNLSITRQTGVDIPVTLSYSLSRGRTLADAASLCSVLRLCTAEARQLVDTARVQSTLGLGIVRTRTNSAINPSRGNQLALDMRFSDEVLGSDPLAQFLKWVAEGAFYHRIRRRSVFSWRVRVGAILAPNLSGQSQETEFIPTEERFYAGGPNTVRGFPPNELGPVVRVIETVRVTDPTPEQLAEDSTLVPTAELDTLVSPTGGNQLFLANAELRFPLLGDRVGGAIFVDAGQVFVRGESLAPFDKLRVTPGIGVRFYTPLGPVRLDLAYNPHRPEAGELFILDNEDVKLADAANPIYQPERSESFLGRLRLNFSIGEAF